MKARDIQRALAACSLFATINQASIEALVNTAELVTVAAGAVLMRQGELGLHVFLIVRGSLQSVLDEGTARALDLGMMGPGEVVGEFCLLRGERRTATVLALTECALIRLERRALLHLADKEVQASLLTIVRERVQRSRLRSVLQPLLGSRASALVRDISEAGTWRSVARGRSLYQLRDPCDAVYIVVNGCAGSL